jgi:hypothetical protein
MIASYETGDKRKGVSMGDGYKDEDSNFVSIPYVKKYNHGFTDVGRTNDNFPVLRYADVMLMIAECLNEQAFAAGGEAFTLLNEVRARAGLGPKTGVGSQDAFRDAIFQERKIELAFENHRWYDLVRSGKAVEVMNAHGVKQKALSTLIPANGYQVTANRLLLPIPQTDVNLDNLTQNPQ